MNQSTKQGNARGTSEVVQRGSSSIHFHCPVPWSSSHNGHVIKFLGRGCFDCQGHRDSCKKEQIQQKNRAPESELFSLLWFVLVGNSQRRGQNVSCDFGGGGGKRTIEYPLQNQFWRPQKMDSSGLCLFPPRKMTGREQWGGRRIIGGGVQNRFGGEALWYVFPSPEFPTPLCFPLT